MEEDEEEEEEGETRTRGNKSAGTRRGGVRRRNDMTGTDGSRVSLIKRLVYGLLFADYVFGGIPVWSCIYAYPRFFE